MKNIILIGLVSLVLFGVSAGLSVWLQTNAAKSTDSAHADEKKKKPADDHGAGGHGDAKGTDKEHADPHKADDKAKLAEAKPAAPSKDADRVEYRRLQMEVVANDMSGQMQDYDKLLKRVAAEMKLVAAERADVDAKLDQIQQAESRTSQAAVDAKKTQTEADEAERANIAQIAALVDQMPPDAAAGIIQQLADSGKTETAVRVLAGMKERTAAKVLTAITDPTIPPLLVERMQKMKRNPVAATKPQ